MSKTIDELKTLANQVKNATVPGENTAERIGELFIDIIDSIAGGSDQIQSDWNQNDSSKKDYIKNKPTIPDSAVLESAVQAMQIRINALLVKNMLDVKNNWLAIVGDYDAVQYSDVIPDTITGYEGLYSPVIRIGYDVSMCYSFYSDVDPGDSVTAFYGTDEPENARDYDGDMTRPHAVLQFTKLENDSYNDGTQKYRYYVNLISPFDGYLVIKHLRYNADYSVICPMLETGRKPTEYSSEMTDYISSHLTSAQQAQAQKNIGLEKAVPNGVASLNTNGIIPTEQLPDEVKNNFATEEDIRALFQ